MYSIRNVNIYINASGKIEILISFETLPNSEIALYTKDTDTIISNQIINEDEKQITFTLVPELDNAIYCVKEKESRIVILVLDIKLYIREDMIKNNIIVDKESFGERFYEIDSLKQPNIEIPPKEIKRNVYSIEQIQDFTHNGDYDRGFNEGFLIGKSL